MFTVKTFIPLLLAACLVSVAASATAPTAPKPQTIRYCKRITIYDDIGFPKEILVCQSEPW